MIRLMLAGALLFGSIPNARSRVTDALQREALLRRAGTQGA
ncbi:hypothetical protein [Bradyrhizobium sp. LMG 9283]